MGDASKEPTDEEREQASSLRGQAAAHYSEQRYAEAVTDYEKAIELNPTNALFYAKRGQCYLKLNKPNACIRDCNRALELNCDSAAAYKFRGRAYRLIGDWQASAKDLRQACNIDFDEGERESAYGLIGNKPLQSFIICHFNLICLLMSFSEADEWLREVQPRAQKLEAHKIKQERKRAEKADRDRQERIRRAQEANKKAAEEQKRQEQAAGNADDDDGGDFDQSDLLNAFKDPEVAAAFQDS